MMKKTTRREFMKRTGSAMAAGAALHWPMTSGIAQVASSSGAPGRGILDVHAHMPLSRFSNPLAGRYSRQPGADNPDAAELRALAEAVRSSSFDLIAEFRIREMDRWGVAQTVIMPIDFGPRGDEDLYWEEVEAVAAVARNHPGRFIPFFACDPRRGDQALEDLDRAAKELGIRGVKIHPLAGFAPDDPEVCYPLYEKCIELQLPVLGHCRPLGRGPGDELYNPQRYGRVAEDFPELKLCLGHFGGPPWREQALEVVAKYPNAYGDLSSYQSFFEEEPEAFFAFLRKVMDSPAAARVMYGTDWPNGREVGEQWIAALRKGGAAGRRVLQPEEVELILSGNARRFLGLPGASAP
ncbi:amidohydrolase [Candidatus Sumerlaeota bacterium]|nr:amidohydrolase [Candidatus Sumerlaeota bacterium]